jgi:hypothetical protein
MKGNDEDERKKIRTYIKSSYAAIRNLTPI